MWELIRRNFNRFTAIIVIFLTSLAVTLPSAPFFNIRVGRDSGVFLYGAWMMLQRQTLYVDVWDHKPPLIFIINAIGLIIGNGSRYGVWFIEFALLLVSLILLYQILLRITDRSTGLLVCILYLFGYFYLLSGGNLTEEYALPIQFTIIFLFDKLLKEGAKFQVWVIFGLLTGISILIKPTTIGISISFIAYYTVTKIIKPRSWKRIISLLVCLISFLLPLTILFTIYALNHQLPELYDALISYNLIYTNKDIISYLKSFNYGIFSISQVHLGTLAFLGLFVGFVKIASNSASENYKRIFYIFAINLPIEIIFSILPGRLYLHYFATILPSIAILSGLFINYLIENLPRINIKVKEGVSLIIIIIAFLNFPLLIEKLSSYSATSLSSANQFLISNTNDKDTILFWGANSVDNFLIKRASPTKYVYLLPLYTKGYANKALIEGFITEILQKKPKFIINTHDANVRFLDFSVTSPKIELGLENIKTNYQHVKSLSGWDIYMLKE